MSTDIQVMGVTYSTSQAAEKLGITEHVLRYMSDQLEDMLEIRRDGQLNREYSDQDILMLKKVNSIRELGVNNYKAIKVLISGKLNEINGMQSKQIELQDFSFSMGDERLKMFANIISDMVLNNFEIMLDSKLDSKLDSLKEDILLESYKGNEILTEIKEGIIKNLNLGELEKEVQELKKLNKEIYVQNSDEKKNIEYKLVKHLEQMEQHFYNVDKKLMDWRDKSEKINNEKDKKKGFLKKIFKRKEL